MACSTWWTAYGSAALLFTVQIGSALNFTIVNGQIFTPGLAIVDAPQPDAPLGGELVEVALDVSTDGRLNFTITNGTAAANNASLGNIMLQEPGSTVKHVKWTWPDCLVGDGLPTGTQSDRGAYNISIRQNFRLNGTDYYTVFDLPISVTNSIAANANRPPCDALNNPLRTPQEIRASADFNVPVMFGPGDATVVQTGTGSNSGQGLGSEASVTRNCELGWFLVAGLAVALIF